MEDSITPFQTAFDNYCTLIETVVTLIKLTQKQLLIGPDEVLALHTGGFTYMILQ